MPDNYLYYGDNLDVLRRKVRDESVDLCYIDPPFNSKRDYNQIYNSIGTEDVAQAQAFTDTWVWDERAVAGFHEILANEQGRFTRQSVELIKGLHAVLGTGSLLAYLVSMTLRITEIQRVLKPAGSFYLHCDPTAGHYLKFVLDSIFLPHGGEFLNEVIWHYTGGGRSRSYFSRKHDTLFWYGKSDRYTFNIDAVRVPYKETSGYAKSGIVSAAGKLYLPNPLGTPVDDVWDIPIINPLSKERLGYPTQKPQALLERIIAASSREGEIVLDAYCGCGTTVAVAQQLNRRWIGIDITYQSIALILRRIEAQYGKEVLANIALDGIPRDMSSAHALANKKDDRVRKEFEKWAVLTYTNNRAIINEKKGADSGIDGIAYSMISATDNAKVILQVKSGHVSRSVVATLRGDMQREGASMAVLITMEPPTAPMIAEAKAAPRWKHPLMGKEYDSIQIVTIQDMVETGKRLDIPMSLEVLKAARRASLGVQLPLMDLRAGEEAEYDGEED